VGAIDVYIRQRMLGETDEEYQYEYIDQNNQKHLLLKATKERFAVVSPARGVLHIPQASGSTW